MSSRVRLVLLVTMAAVAVVVVVRWVGGFANRDVPQVGNSIVRYATEDCIAACYLRPQRLHAHELFGSTPLGVLIPARVSLSRLDALQVEELAVFCATDGTARQIEWAAVARTTAPIDLATALPQWRQSLVSFANEPAVDPLPESVGGFSCVRLPAGTFLLPPRRYGQLQFTDRQGQPKDRGIHIGEMYPRRGYVEGATASAAIFTLDDIDAASLVDGQLELELRPKVFRTYFLEQEFATARIELRNPVSGLRSEPIAFRVKSFINHRLDVPRQLEAADRQVDLISDLVADGQLDVIVTLEEAATYLGLGRHDLNVRPQGFEYAFVSGRELIVAQSARMLEQMLTSAGAPVPLASRLAEPDSDLVVVADVRDGAEQTAWHQLLGTIRDRPAVAPWGDQLRELTATLHLAPAPVANVTAVFADRRQARTAASQLQDRLQTARVEVHASLDANMKRLAAVNSLRSLGMDGVSTQFPQDETQTIEQQVEQYLATLLALVDETLDRSRIRRRGYTVIADAALPTDQLPLSATARYGLSNLEEIFARYLFARERFDQGDELYRRVTQRCPHDSTAWFRRAHELSYNVSVNFDGNDRRYAWVRNGINVLLDGAEQNPDSADLTWMAARFIGRKIGTADERRAYRELFCNDQPLHQRLAPYIDLDQTQSPDQRVDNWLVAKLLFEHAVTQAEKTGVPSTIAAPLFFSRSAAMQARYAQMLSDMEHWDESLEAWREAERLHRELGDREIPLGAADSLKLNDLQQRLAEFGSEDARVQQLQAARKRIRYDFWLMRCQLEQTSEVRSARKLAQQAAQRADRAELEPAAELYRQSLDLLIKLQKDRPDELAQLAGDLRHVATGYRKIAEQLGATTPESLDAFLTQLEQSRSISDYLLLDADSPYQLER